MTPSPLLSRTAQVPPEASTGYHPVNCTAHSESEALAHADADEDCMAWNPDCPESGHLADEEGITLETRGLTQQVTTPHTPASGTLKQREIWRSSEIHKATISSKLRQVGELDLAKKLDDCHTSYTYCQCNDCGTTRMFPNRCDIFLCPACARHLQMDRERQVSWWTHQIRQPKHVTLTVKNIPDLSAGHVRQLRAWFTRLRRRTFARNWRGGFYRIECTNEGKGWHLHLHALIDCEWIDALTLRDEWLSVTNGHGCIIKVRDARGADYLHEVTKYVAKGSQIAAWKPDSILTFVRAFTARRTFGVFGSLYGKRTEWREWLEQLGTRRPLCDCGSRNISYYSETDWLARTFDPGPSARPRPPTHQQQLLPTIDLHQRWHI